MKKTDKKIKKNVKNDTKSVKLTKKTYSEEEFYNIVQIAQTYEVILARATAMIGVFLGDEMKKYDFLKEYMAVDRDARKLSNRFDKEVKSAFFSLKGKDE